MAKQNPSQTAAQSSVTPTGKAPRAGVKRNAPAATAPRPAAKAPAPAPRQVAGRPTQAVASRLAAIQRGIRETVAELRKVQWPDRMTTRNLTLVVIGMSLALSAILGVFDEILTRLVEWLIRL